MTSEDTSFSRLSASRIATARHLRRRDGGHRDFIRGSDDRAEDSGDRPGEPDERVADGGHRRNGREDETDREEKDRAQIPPVLAVRRVDRFPVEKRGKKHEEDEVGLELHAWQAGDEPESQSTDDEEDR